MAQGEQRRPTVDPQTPEKAPAQLMGRLPLGGISRRRLLTAIGIFGLSLATSVVASVRSRGYTLSPNRKLTSLSKWQFVVVQQAAMRIAAPDRPQDRSIPSADDLDVAGFVDGWMARADESIRRDMRRFLAFLEHLAPLGCGFASRFTKLGPNEQDRILAALESSPSELLRAGFEGLKALIFMGYYDQPRTWAIAGYDGPLVHRPVGGWH